MSIPRRFASGVTIMVKRIIPVIMLICFFQPAGESMSANTESIAAPTI